MKHLDSALPTPLKLVKYLHQVIPDYKTYSLQKGAEPHVGETLHLGQRAQQLSF